MQDERARVEEKPRETAPVAAGAIPEAAPQARPAAVKEPRKPTRKYGLALYLAWCKRCAICGEFCPTGALVEAMDRAGFGRQLLESRRMSGFVPQRDKIDQYCTDEPTVYLLLDVHLSRTRGNRMKIHEYQAHALLREYGIPVAGGIVAATPEDAAAAAREVGFPAVLKAQVHSGGRGKAGGVRRVANEEEARSAAAAILALSIKGLPVRKVLVVPAASIRAEAYLSLLVDRAADALVFVGCAAGGVEIEETARTSPEKIMRLALDPLRAGVDADQCMRFAERLFDGPEAAVAAARIMADMERLFRARDCALVEINPLALTSAGVVLALDAKILLDDNALFRQGANEALRDRHGENGGEVEARAAGLSFIELGGSIGCMVNGAGLAMATMDAIKHLGGEPANFLDVGGSSSPEKILSAFKIIVCNPRVKVILVNIFGGITRCDDVARGILAARAELGFKVPLVVRLVGTNEPAARELLAGEALESAASLEAGALRAVELGARQ